MVAVDGDNEKKAAFIADPKERMSKWKRMSDSVMKKAMELSTLCDTPTCIVISPPTNEDGTTPMDSCSSKFAMWPIPTHDDHDASLRRMIDLYKASQSCKTHNSPSTVKAARATKKVKVNKYNNDIDVDVCQAKTSVSCGGGLPSIQTGSGNVELGRQVEEAGKSALVAVNARMDHDDTIVNVEENNNINAIIDAYGTANAKEKHDVDDQWRNFVHWGWGQVPQ